MKVLHEFLLKVFTFHGVYSILYLEEGSVIMRQGKAVNRLREFIVPGQVYRRADLAVFSSNVDRYLARLVAEGHIKKVSQGMYSAPRATPFGEVPPEMESLVKAFLKDDHFVVYGPSQFNSLGLGTTQLYNRLTVFNRKRVGEFTLGGRTFTFHRWREAPKKLTPEFLIVELLNRLDDLAEDRDQVLARLKEKLAPVFPVFPVLNDALSEKSYPINKRKLRFAATHYGTLTTQKLLASLSAPMATSAPTTTAQKEETAS